MSMVGKARARPDQVRKVLDTVAQQGAVATYKKVMNRLDSYTPLGYSLCGVVVEVGAGRRGVPGRPAGRGRGQRVRAARRVQLGPGQPVRPRCPTGSRPSTPRSPPSAPSPCRACAGPRSSWATRPASSGSAWSASWWCGSWSPPGSGSSGSTSSRSAAGWPRRRAPACAPRPTDDGHRRGRAGAARDDRRPRRRPRVPRRGRRRPTGRSSSPPGWPGTGRTVVDIGKTAWTCRGTPTTTRSSTSGSPGPTGPGRYDDRYELEGIDYPAGYVRWTERRNLECFLDLLAGKDDRGGAAHLRRVPRWTRRPRVYDRLAAGTLSAVGFVLLELPRRAAGRSRPRGRPAAVRLEPRRPPAPQRRHSARLRGRLHRRRQLRHLDAAAAPGQARRRRPGPRRDHPVAVGGQRPAPVRLHDRVHRPRTPCSRTRRWTRSSS